jgi:hypothetical protein
MLIKKMKLKKKNLAMNFGEWVNGQIIRVNGGYI